MDVLTRGLKLCKVRQNEGVDRSCRLDWVDGAGYHCERPRAPAIFRGCDNLQMVMSDRDRPGQLVARYRQRWKSQGRDAEELMKVSVYHPIQLPEELSAHAE